MEKYTLRKATINDIIIYKNIFNMYQNEISQYLNEVYTKLDNNGYFEPEVVNDYFQDNNCNNSILPYLIIDSTYNEHNSQNNYYGIIVISKAPYVKKGCDYCIQEMFIIPFLRGKNIAYELINKLINNYNGRYCLNVIKKNKRALAFWDKIIKANNFKKIETDNDELLTIEFFK